MSAAGNQEEMEEICRSGGITADDLENPDMKISLEQDARIIESGLMISGDPFLGLHTGEKTTQVVLGLTGFLIESSKNVLSSLENLQQFHSTISRLLDFRIEEAGDEIYFYCVLVELWKEYPADIPRVIVDVSFSSALHIIKLLTGRTLKPVKVSYSFPPVEDASEYERILRCKPQFSQNCNCVVFSRQDMLSPVIGYNKELNRIFNKLLEEELTREETSFADKVKNVLVNHYQFEFPPLDRVASHLNITNRTLQRKLNDEKTTFRQLTDSLKKELAQSMLKNKSLTVTDVAYKLGYAEPGAFLRAFRAWTGQTPGSFRSSFQGN